MEIIKLVVAISILILAIPLGYLLKILTKEEIPQGRIYFEILWVTSLVIGSILFFINFNNEYYKYTILFTLIFISIISFISWYNSKNKWNKKRQLIN